MSDKRCDHNVTAEQVKEVVAQQGFDAIAHHKCSLCGYQTKYVFMPGGDVAFDPGCYCTSGGNLQRSSFGDIVALFNMQKPEIRQTMWDAFKAGKPLID